LGVRRLDRSPLSAAAEPAAIAPSLDRANRLVAGDMARVNQLILDRLQSQVTMIPELAAT
jgi:hypothetical protein